MVSSLIKTQGNFPWSSRSAQGSTSLGLTLGRHSKNLCWVLYSSYHLWFLVQCLSPEWLMIRICEMKDKVFWIKNWISIIHLVCVCVCMCKFWTLNPDEITEFGFTWAQLEPPRGTLKTPALWCICGRYSADFLLNVNSLTRPWKWPEIFCFLWDPYFGMGLPCTVSRPITQHT